jgi:hypothetical protein
MICLAHGVPCARPVLEIVATTGIFRPSRQGHCCNLTNVLPLSPSITRHMLRRIRMAALVSSGRQIGRQLWAGCVDSVVTFARGGKAPDAGAAFGWEGICEAVVDLKRRDRAWNLRRCAAIAQCPRLLKAVS